MDGLSKVEDLDRRLRIEQNNRVRDAAGQMTASWSEMATVWCSWRRASARETLAAAEVSAAITDVFEILYSPNVADVDPTCRLVFNGRNYDVVSAEEVGRRDRIRITASARADK